MFTISHLCDCLPNLLRWNVVSIVSFAGLLPFFLPFHFFSSVNFFSGSSFDALSSKLPTFLWTAGFSLSKTQYWKFKKRHHQIKREGKEPCKLISIYLFVSVYLCIVIYLCSGNKTNTGQYNGWYFMDYCHDFALFFFSNSDFSSRVSSSSPRSPLEFELPIACGYQFSLCTKTKVVNKATVRV